MSLIGLEGSCECGAVKLRTSSKSEAWGLFVCHCSMCPDHSYTDSRVGSGVGWLAVPRDEDLYYDSSRHVDTRRTSEFARRAYCKQCGSKLTMQYDCEPYTTWICIDRFRIGRDQVIALAKNKAHIHCADTIDEGAKGQKGDDGINAFHSWEPWLPDPCRPDHVADPSVCSKCFHIENTDCSGPPSKCGPDGCTFEVIKWEDLKKKFLGETSE